MSIYNKIIDLQKLGKAWEKVRRNKPAAGVDNVTYEQFEEGKQENLKQLHIDLKNHSYKALPVRRVVLYKGEKEREIALYAMRDKVVQQSLASELNRLYDDRLSVQTYAYRNNKSSLNAVNVIEENIQSKKYSWALKIDIMHFFDEIEWRILRSILERDIKEKDVLFLIEENAKSVTLEDSGELVEKRKGIYQGSGISPVLSNIYLMEFDRWLAGTRVFYVRYADDMILLGTGKDELLELLASIKIRLNQMGLRVNERKTCLVPLSDGFDMLGYHFSLNGKSIPVKAEQSLLDRLETMWLTSADLSIEEKMKKAVEIIGGWEQYFREKRKTGSIFEYMALIYATQQQERYMDELEEQRAGVTNIYKDIAIYLAEVWKRSERGQAELLEYEQYYQIWKPEGPRIEKEQKELLENYRKTMISESHETAIELMQIYTDRGEYEKAGFWMERGNQLQNDRQRISDADISHISDSSDREIIFNQATAQKMIQAFAGREDMFGMETLGYGGKRQTEMQAVPLSEQKVKEHLEGNITIGTYIQRPNSTVRYLVTDIDISKKVMLQITRDSAEFQAYLEQAWRKAQEIKKIFKNLGMYSYIECSGCRGYHVWVLFSEWIPVRYVNMLSDVIEGKLTKKEQDEICIEFFPNKTRVKAGKFGQVLKLPYGRHTKTGERSYFFDDSGEPITDLNCFLDSLSKNTLNAVKQVLAKNIETKEQIQMKTVDTNLEAFGELANKILEMKKQKRGIDAAILKIEKELEKIYDNAKVDCLEVEMGMLVRRKTEKGYEWLIEI